MAIRELATNPNTGDPSVPEDIVTIFWRFEYIAGEKVSCSRLGESQWPRRWGAGQAPLREKSGKARMDFYVRGVLAMLRAPVDAAVATGSAFNMASVR